MLLVLLLLSHHRLLRNITEALELRVEFGRVSHSWCICVVSHGYGGFDLEWKKVVDGMHARQRGCSHVGRCRNTFRVRGDTLMTPDHTAVKVRSSG